MAEKLKARIFHVEDDKDSLKSFDIVLQLFDHNVVLTAGSVAQALSYIPEKLIKSKVNLALIDGNLPDGSGDQVAYAIRKSGLPIAIFALAGEPQVFGDQNFHKKDGPKPVLEAIANFLKPK